MAVLRTLVEPSADEQIVDIYNRDMRLSNHEDLIAGRKWAVVLLKLAPGVSQPADYPAMGAAINAVTGIQGVELLLDGQARAIVPTGKHQVIYVDIHLRMEPVPEA